MECGVRAGRKLGKEKLTYFSNGYLCSNENNILTRATISRPTHAGFRAKSSTSPPLVRWTQRQPQPKIL